MIKITYNVKFAAAFILDLQLHQMFYCLLSLYPKAGEVIRQLVHDALPISS